MHYLKRLETAQEEIAAKVDRDRSTISEEIATFVDFGSLSKSHETACFYREKDFKPTRLESRVTGQSANK